MKFTKAIELCVMFYPLIIIIAHLFFSQNIKTSSCWLQLKLFFLTHNTLKNIYLEYLLDFGFAYSLYSRTVVLKVGDIAALGAKYIQ